MGIVRRVIIGFLFAASPALGVAQTMAPESFVRADVEAREATLDGMARRVTQIEAGASMQAQLVASEAVQLEVEAIFERYGATAGSHAAYGTRHGAEVSAWLESQPEWQARYTELDGRFESLSQQLNALLGGN